MTTTQLPTVIELLGPPEEFDTDWDEEFQGVWDIQAVNVGEAREVLADLLDLAKQRGYDLDSVIAQARTVRPGRARARKQVREVRHIMLSALARYQDAQA